MISIRRLRRKPQRGNPHYENPDDENPDDEKPCEHISLWIYLTMIISHYDENPDDENPDDENPYEYISFWIYLDMGGHHKKGGTRQLAQKPQAFIPVRILQPPKPQTFIPVKIASQEFHRLGSDVHF